MSFVVSGMKSLLALAAIGLAVIVQGGQSNSKREYGAIIHPIKDTPPAPVLEPRSSRDPGSDSNSQSSTFSDDEESEQLADRFSSSSSSSDDTRVSDASSASSSSSSSASC